MYHQLLNLDDQKDIGDYASEERGWETGRNSPGVADPDRGEYKRSGRWRDNGL